MIDNYALETMRKRGGDWYAYENRDLGHPHAGHLKFLQCGEGRTLKSPPKRHPDTASEINWRYLLVGPVNLESGKVEECRE